MPATTTSPSTFSLFSSLALELRTQIWQESLPSEFSPALYFYKRGCWKPRIFTESDPGYYDGVGEQSSTEDLNRNLEFRYDLLDNIHVLTPLLFVNHEARKITLTWARSHGIEICGDPLFPRLSLLFNPIRDILYVPADHLHEFFMEPVDRSYEKDMIHLTHGIFNEVKRFAVLEAKLGCHIAMGNFDGLSDNYNTELLYVIINTPLGLRSVDDDLHVQTRWGCASLPSCTFILDSNRSAFELKGDGENEDEQIHLLPQEISRNLTQAISRHLTPEFITKSPSIREIRPVFAVKG
ncbi:hypothetical protein BHYA_0390g00040 [Botrytis hyacinthi]|uniref:2EXR domain-containing protein n=1 Tax=Botrytis hyacinthi TaxID=278943 RepID=A0A4Z1GCD9_9HELO|nr:hypothetical protein BHYA_0390g00040 [Botrytis hyacinthi]